jgi:hypothetical protein
MTSRFAFLEPLLGWGRGSCLGFVLALLPGNALAQALPIELVWRAPPECPQRDAVLSSARALLGNQTAKMAKVRAEGTIEKRADGFELSLSIGEGGNGGQRTVPARRCDKLSDAAAIALVLLLTTGSDDQGADAEAALPGVDRPSERPAPAVPEKPQEPAQKADRTHALSKAERGWRGLVAGPQLAIAVGPLPQPTLGVGASLGVQGHAWSVQLLGQWFSTQSVAAPIEAYGADVKRAAIGLWGCWDIRREIWSFSPCLVASATHLRGTGYGPFLRSATQTDTSVGAGVGAIGRLRPCYWLSLMLGAGLQIELSRPIIELGGVGTVRQLAPVSAVVLLGPEWIF